MEQDLRVKDREPVEVKDAAKGSQDRNEGKDKARSKVKAKGEAKAGNRQNEPPPTPP